MNPSTTRPTRTSTTNFWVQLHRFGPQTALISGGQAITYARLEHLVAARATALGEIRRLRVLELSPDLDAVVDYLAFLRAGHPVVLVGPGQGDTLTRQYADAVDLHPELAVLLPTSGSSGSPKLVRLSAENLTANARSIIDGIGLRPEDRAFLTLPLHYSYGLSVLNSHLAVGASVVLTTKSVIDSDFTDAFNASGANNFAGVPHTFHLLDRAEFDFSRLSNLRFVTQAGGRLAPERVAELSRLSKAQGWRFWAMYGQTEATARIAILQPDDAETHPASVGRVISGGTVEIDRRAGEPGELVYRGPNVMLGYAETAADLARGRDIEALHTGDLAEIDADGFITLRGRVARVVKPLGLRIELDALERGLAEEGIDATCAGDDSLVVVAVPGGAPEGLAKRLATQLKLPPTSLVVLSGEGLPRLESGKVDLPNLVTLGHQRRLSFEDSSDSTVLSLFRSRFGDHVSDADSFVACGGDSLTYIEVSVALEELLGHLPANWHELSVDRLESMQEERSGVLRRVETSIVLRAVAITLIVGTHTGLWALAGGAHVLLAVAGFNFARFQAASSVGSRVRSLGRIAVPSCLWIGGAALLSSRVDWPQALMINAFVIERGEPWQYWFIEALVWLLAGSLVLLALPGARRVVRRHPLWLPFGLLLATLVFRFDLFGAAATHHRLGRPIEVAWLFAFGWAAAAASGWKPRLLVGALGLAAVPGFFGDSKRDAVVAVGLGLLLLVSNVTVPRIVVRVMTVLAGASLYIYLVHWQVFPVVGRNLGAPAAFLLSLAAGVVAWRLSDPLVSRWSRQPG